MDCAAAVVTREDSRKLCNAFRVGVLKSTEHGVIGVGGIFAPDAVSICDNAAIDTSAIAVCETC
jgi:hypothetical protein